MWLLKTTTSQFLKFPNLEVTDTGLIDNEVMYTGLTTNIFVFVEKEKEKENLNDRVIYRFFYAVMSPP